jgi:hypothetical protein
MDNIHRTIHPSKPLFMFLCYTGWYKSTTTALIGSMDEEFSLTTQSKTQCLVRAQKCSACRLDYLLTLNPNNKNRSKFHSGFENYIVLLCENMYGMQCVADNKHRVYQENIEIVGNSRRKLGER